MNSNLERSAHFKRVTAADFQAKKNSLWDIWERKISFNRFWTESGKKQQTCPKGKLFDSKLFKKWWISEISGAFILSGAKNPFNFLWDEKIRKDNSEAQFKERATSGKKRLLRLSTHFVAQWLRRWLLIQRSWVRILPRVGIISFFFAYLLQRLSFHNQTTLGGEPKLIRLRNGSQHNWI